jgi:hypothetical protein
MNCIQGGMTLHGFNSLHGGRCTDENQRCLWKNSTAFLNAPSLPAFTSGLLCAPFVSFDSASGA